MRHVCMVAASVASLYVAIYASVATSCCNLFTLNSYVAVVRVQKVAPVARVGLALLQVGLSSSGVPVPLACLAGQSADSSAQLVSLALPLFGTPASATASGADVSRLLQGVSGEEGLTRPAYEAVAVLLRQVDGMARGGDTWAGSSARPEDTRRGSKTDSAEVIASFDHRGAQRMEGAGRSTEKHKQK